MRPGSQATGMADYVPGPDSLRILRAGQARDQGGATPEQATAARARVR